MSELNLTSILVVLFYSGTRQKVQTTSIRKKYGAYPKIVCRWTLLENKELKRKFIEDRRVIEDLRRRVSC